MRSPIFGSSTRIMARIVSGTEGIRETVAALRRGEVVGLPTETVYGLAADIRNESALKKIFEVKGRPTSHPLIVHIADPEQLRELAINVSAACEALIRLCWPGPLTVIVTASPRVSRAITGGRDSVAVRLPAHPLAQTVIRDLGSPVAAPSANSGKRPSASTSFRGVSQGCMAPEAASIWIQRLSFRTR